MEITTKELRRSPGKTLARVSRGQVLIVTYRGKRIAKIVPMEQEKVPMDDDGDLLFGLWKDRPLGENVDAYIREMRRRRRF